MRYLLYARKSSESDDKQAQSIDDQLKELRQLAAQRGLLVVAELTEAKSAKNPGARPVFAEMVSRIQEGQADAILCWHVNRLFRNPVDFGTLSWMLQTGALREIHTPTQVHRCGDNVLLLSVENGMANQYILDLRKAVTRGLNSKVEKGWFPHKAPEGYLNRDGIIVVDPERFDLVRRAWDLMLAGEHTPPQVLDIMTTQWGYTTKKLSRIGGAAFSRTSIYNLFSNIFYTGYFKRNGEIFQGQHPPMITMEEFLRVQAHLSRRFKKCQRVHGFAYSGLMECGECGRAIVGDLKRVKLKSGAINTHIYYACSNAGRTCSRRSITEEGVDRQIQKVLESISIPEPLLKLGREVINDWQAQQGDPAIEEIAVIERELDVTRRKRDRLLDMKLSDLLSDFEYLEQKERLTAHLSSGQIRLQELRDKQSSAQENLHNVLHLAACGELAFELGEPAFRALIAKTLGARYVLVNKSLAIELNPVLSPLCEMKEKLNAFNREEKPSSESKNALEIGSGSQDEDVLGAKYQVWWATLDAIRAAFFQGSHPVPRLEGFAWAPLAAPSSASRRAGRDPGSKGTG
jgi:DNA invertase Pin-like site-specific DNA recombinase